MGQGLPGLFVSSYSESLEGPLGNMAQAALSSSRATRELSGVCSQASVSAPGGAGAAVCSQEADDNHNDHY